MGAPLTQGGRVPLDFDTLNSSKTSALTNFTASLSPNYSILLFTRDRKIRSELVHATDYDALDVHSSLNAIFATDIGSLNNVCFVNVKF